MDFLFYAELLFNLANVHIILIRIFNGRLKFKRGVVILAPFLLLVSFSIIFTDGLLWDFCVVVITLLAGLIPLYTLGNIYKSQIVYISLLYYGASYSIAASFRWIIQLFTPDIFTRMVVNAVLYAFFLAICVLFSFNFVFYRAKQYITLISMKLKVLLLTSVWISTAFALFLSLFAEVNERTPHLVFAELSAAAMIFTVGIMWPFMIVGSSLNVSYKAALSRLDGQIRAQVRQYELVLRANKDIRRFKHDFNNLKVGLARHLRDGDPRGALVFLEECEQSIQGEYISFQTGNAIADALLSEKLSAAKQKHILIAFNGVIPGAGISPMDICIILGNLMDNALEACAALPGEKTVSVSSYLNNGFFFLAISNPVTDNVPVHNGLPATTKIDRRSHGIGLVSTRNAIQKYNGRLKLSCEDRVFTAEIALDLNEISASP
jgi:hypothetical protein